MNEQKRILEAYQTRKKRANAGFFGYENLAHVLRVQERHRETLRLLAGAGYHSLAGLRILDIGCGNGNMLRQFLEWGATPAHLVGLELRSEPVEQARHLNPALDIRCGSATTLPWATNSFNLVCLHTVFTSILDFEMKETIVAEINRVLGVGGAVLWYDFIYNNPRNPDVQGISLNEIRTLFPNYDVRLRRVTLAPPLARRLPTALLPVFYPLLATVPFLRTHYLGLLLKPA